jgi:dienelactone hydrolase
MITLALMIGLTAAPAYARHDDLSYYRDRAEKHPIENAADWKKRRAHILAGMAEAMGPLPDPDRRVPFNMEILEEKTFPGYTRKKITFGVEKGDRLPAWLLIPRQADGPFPAILCLHPTCEDGKDICAGISGKENRNYAEELAQRGYVTLAPDYPGFGEYRAARPWLYENGYGSCTMKGIWNHMRCIDLLQSLPETDGQRIGCIGHSLGGHNTLYLGVFDPRVRVLVTSCGFNAFRRYRGGDLTGWSHDGYMPRIASVYQCDPARMPFDFHEVLGAIAPRPLFINAPLHDDNFEVSGVRECVKAAGAVYDLYKTRGHLKAVYPDADHDFPDAVREEAYAFLGRFLQSAD